MWKQFRYCQFSPSCAHCHSFKSKKKIEDGGLIFNSQWVKVHGGLPYFLALLLYLFFKSLASWHTFVSVKYYHRFQASRTYWELHTDFYISFGEHMNHVCACVCDFVSLSHCPGVHLHLVSLS